MRFLFLIILHLLFHQVVFSQKHLIYLDKQKLDIPLTFKIDSVVDARAEKDCIGVIFKKISNQKTLIYFESSAAKTFKKVLDNSPVTVKNPSVLTLRINKLLVYENSYNDQEIAIAELNVSFLIKQNDQYYELFRTGTRAELASAEVTNLHGRNIIKALETCIKQYDTRTNYFKQTKLIATVVTENSLEKHDEPISSTTTYKKGIYRTYFDFRDNTPDISSAINIQYQGDSTEPQHATAQWSNTDLPLNQIWGFSDGNKIFVNDGDNFQRLNRKENTFYLAKSSKSSSATLTTNPFVGLIGGLRYYSQKNRIPVCNNTVPINPDSLDKPAYRLDFAIGRFVPYAMVEIKAEGKVVIYVSKLSKADQAFDLYINGKMICTLKKETFYAFTNKPGENEVNICLKNSLGESCQPITFKLFETDVYLARFKKGKPVLDHPTAIKKDLLNEINSAKVMRVCD